MLEISATNGNDGKRKMRDAYMSAVGENQDPNTVAARPVMTKKRLQHKEEPTKQLAVKEEIEKSVSSSDEEGDTAQDNKALGATSSD